MENHNTDSTRFRPRMQNLKPSHRICDRFIPYRRRLNADMSYAKIMAHENGMDSLQQPAQLKNPHMKYYHKLLDAVFEKGDTRILPTTQRHDSDYTVSMSPRQPFFSASMDSVLVSPPPRHRRHLSKSPICVMDMPRLRNDIYTNNLDWGSTNKIAVALQLNIYVWNADSKECQKLQLMTSGPSHDYISSLAWDPLGRHLAMGDSLGDVVVLDPLGSVIMSHRICNKEKTPVSIIRWTDEGIYSGAWNGTIYKHDPRTKKLVTHLIGHTQTVCGLSQAEGTPYLASGGEDGVVCIWDTRTDKLYRSLQAHSSFTKAVAWCPWKKNVLASGGGTHDGNIRLWDVNTGETLGEVLTFTQNCGILWSEEYRELVSIHGSAEVKSHETNDIIVWKVTDFQLEAIDRLQQHQDRPLHLVMSPDKTHIASVGADESLCLWNCFPKVSKKRNVDSVLSLSSHIR